MSFNFSIKKIIFSVLILILTIFLFELISYIATKLRIFSYNYTPAVYLKNTIHHENWRTEKEEWGSWHKKNAITRHTTKCFDVIYESNSYGARDEEFKKNNNAIILLGDSFAEGWGVSKSNTFEVLLEKKLNTDIYNFGSAYNFGPLQYYILYKQLVTKLNFKKKIILFLPGNDFVDNNYEYWSKNNQFFFDASMARYRPYYLNTFKKKFHPMSKKRESFLETFEESSLVYNIKIFLKKYMWSTNLIMETRIILKKIKNKFNKKQTSIYSGYYDESEDAQRLALYYIKKIVNYDDIETILISVPSFNDIIKSKKNEIIPYWKDYLKKLDIQNPNFKYFDILDHINKSIEKKKMFNSCDGHWNKEGNLIAADLLYPILSK